MSAAANIASRRQRASAINGSTSSIAGRLTTAPTAPTSSAPIQPSLP